MTAGHIQLPPDDAGKKVKTYLDAADGSLHNPTTVLTNSDGIPIGEVSVRTDDTGTGTTYIGEAAPGTATSAAGWRVRRMVEAGADITVLWADGDAHFDNVWDNRASLSYS